MEINGVVIEKQRTKHPCSLAQHVGLFSVLLDFLYTLQCTSCISDVITIFFLFSDERRNEQSMVFSQGIMGAVLFKS